MRCWGYMRFGGVATGYLVAWLAVCAIAQPATEPEAPAEDLQPPTRVADMVTKPGEVEPEIEAISLVDVESPTRADGVEACWVKTLPTDQLDGRSVIAMLPVDDGFYLLLGKDMKLGVFRFDETGRERWRRELSPEFSGSVAFMTFNAEGNLVVTGTAETPLVTTAGDVLNKVYVVELDPEGNLLTDQKFSLGFNLPGVLAEQLGVELEVTDIAWTPEGDAFLAGALWGQMRGGVQAVPFLARVDDRGETDWSQLLAPEVPHLTGNDAATFRVVVAEDTILLAGSTRASLDGANQGGTDIFIAAYSNAGDMAWCKQYGSAEDDDLIEAYGDASGFTLMGVTEGDLADHCVGRSDGFILHCDTSGTWDWGVQSGQASSDAYRALLFQEGTTTAVGGVDGEFRLSQYDDQGEPTWSKSLSLDGLFLLARVSLRDDGAMMGWGRFFASAGDDTYYEGTTVIFCLEPSWAQPPDTQDETAAGD